LVALGSKKLLPELDNIPPDSSVMVALKEKETKLKEDTLKAKKEAERLVAKARAKAGKICDEARLMGNKKGKQLIDNGLSKAQQEAQATKEESKLKIKEIKKQANANFKPAVNLIVDIVIGDDRKKSRAKDKNVSANG